MKIAITGAMGVGKTTLAKQIAQMRRIKLLPEQARLIAERGLKLDKGITEETERLIAELQEGVERGAGWIADRCFIDLLAYVQILFPTDLRLQSEIRQKMFRANYDIIFYLPIEFALEDDGLRSMDKQFQKQIDMQIKKNLKDFGHYAITGTRSARLEKALRIIDKYI